VSPGVLLAIWGMETGFGSAMGNQNTVSAILTLAYDCRRPEFFHPHAIAALKLVDRGALITRHAAAHGEIGHTQFLA
jgi:membrane-bound lytic murein transglycosylase B